MSAVHELAMTRDIIDTVIDAAKANDAHEIRKVSLTIGQLRDIVDSLFVRCFEHFSQGTIAQGAQVEIDKVPFTVRCDECGRTWQIDDIHDDTQFVCPACGASHYEMQTGMEFYINKLEVA